ncbi:MAG: hypothetical protein JOZ39_06950 [Chloroflexi bacterium]|nr:hypothetical protein [Chloroflexota bacterium]
MGDGYSMADLLDMPEDQAHLLNWLSAHDGGSAEEAAAELNSEFENVAGALKALVEKGFVVVLEGAPKRYRAHRAAKQNRPRMGSDLWRALEP